jgi:hypothetical protein
LITASDVATPTRQFVLNAVVPVQPGSEAALEALLRTIGDETRNRMKGRGAPPSRIDFEKVTSVHFARWVTMEASAGGKVLALNTWFDGPVGDSVCSEPKARMLHLRELVTHARAGLDEVYAHCVGYPGASATEEEVVGFFDGEAARRPTGAIYFGSPGRSRDQILAEAELAKSCRAWVDAQHQAGASVTAAGLRAAMQTHVAMLGTFPAQQKSWEKLVPTGLGVASLALLGLPVILAAAAVLRIMEKTDCEFEFRSDADERRHVDATTANENQFFQNALSNVVEVKAGMFRRLLLSGSLFAVDKLARWFFVDGSLGEIPSIHAAHWYLIEGVDGAASKRLAFVSNYDSSWESYLGDFIDKAGTGLTAIWSNTKDYPRAVLLAFAGSEKGDLFKAWSHHIQVETLVWYSAYPWLSITNVNNNTLIRRGLADPGIPSAQWLELL